jgi:hypothetical protein
VNLFILTRSLFSPTDLSLRRSVVATTAENTKAPARVPYNPMYECYYLIGESMRDLKQHYLF